MNQEALEFISSQKIPQELLREASACIGRVEQVIPLSGMGKGRVWRLAGQKGKLVLKGSSCAVETQFYSKIAPTLTEVSISVPELYFSAKVENEHWIGLEFIPHELPRSRWHHDEQIIRAIARLHSLALDRNKFSGLPYSWPVEFIEDATHLFPEQERDRLLRLWLKIRNEFTHILEPSVFISGDPSGRNWALRENGELVLFDWERAGFAAPAVDLMAIAFDQLKHEQFQEIAETYSQASSRKVNADRLAEETKAGRAYIISEILSRASKEESVIPQRVVEHLTGSFSAWLDREFSFLGTKT